MRDVNSLQKVPCLNWRSLDPFLSPSRPGAVVTACSLRPSADASRDTANSPLAPQSHPCSPVPPQEQQQGIGSGVHQTAPRGTQGIATFQHGTACIIWGKRGGPVQGIAPAAPGTSKTSRVPTTGLPSSGGSSWHFPT